MGLVSSKTREALSNYFPGHVRHCLTITIGLVSSKTREILSNYLPGHVIETLSSYQYRPRIFQDTCKHVRHFLTIILVSSRTLSST